MVSETTIRTAVVNKIIAVDATARVHRRRRYPKQERIEEYRSLFLGTNGTINAYMIRRLHRVPSVHGVPKRLVSVTYGYEIRFYFGLTDSDNDGAASEETAQARIDQLATAFEADNTLGLGATVGHDGLAMVLDFEDIALGDWACHRARLAIEITAQNAC